MMHQGQQNLVRSKMCRFPKIIWQWIQIWSKSTVNEVRFKKSIIPSNGKDVCTAVSEEMLFINFITIRMTMIWRVQVSAAENIFLEHTVKIRVRPEVQAKEKLVILSSASSSSPSSWSYSNWRLFNFYQWCFSLSSCSTSCSLSPSSSWSSSL